MNVTEAEYQEALKDLAEKDIDLMDFEKGIELVKTDKDYTILQLIKGLEEEEDLEGLETLWVGLTSLAMPRLIELQIEVIEGEL